MTKIFSIHDWQDKQKHLSLKLEQVGNLNSDGEIEISLEDLDFETLKNSFPNNYQKEKFIRPQTG